MTVRVVCPGSFDPMHAGHLDVFTRAAERFDEVVVAVVDNPNKQAMFDLDERLAFIKEQTAQLDNVRAAPFEGLLVDFCVANDISLICKGLRGVTDFEYELQMAHMNRQLAGVETIFLPSTPSSSHLSSSLIKEVARLGGTISGMLPEPIEAALLQRLQQR